MLNIHIYVYTCSCAYYHANPVSYLKEEQLKNMKDKLSQYKKTIQQLEQKIPQLEAEIPEVEAEIKRMRERHREAMPALDAAVEKMQLEWQGFMAELAGDSGACSSGSQPAP